MAVKSMPLPASPPDVPDHELIRRVGSGQYGDVWLARNIMGSYRAAKVIYRQRFDQERPFEREFLGIKKFEPISRTHPGFVNILHVGRSLGPTGYFYYIMEIADDVRTGQRIAPEEYAPKTLQSAIVDGGRIPLDECLGIGQALLEALGHLHQHGLIHRDIKPANIIFVAGAPKFADVGLVTEMGETASLVGTEGYLPPEGPGDATADIYSLGRVLWEIAMGKPRHQFPEAPNRPPAEKDAARLYKLNEIILKACDFNARKRFQSADEMLQALAALALRDGAVASVSGAGGPGTQVVPPETRRVTLLFDVTAQPDERVAGFLEEQFVRQEFTVFADRSKTVNIDSLRETETKIQNADAVVVLVSETSAQSEMLAYQLEMANESAQQHAGKPRILPVRLNYRGPLGEPLGRLLNPLHQVLWEGPQHHPMMLASLLQALQNSPADAAGVAARNFDTPGGAVPLDSEFYVVRAVDREFESAIARHDSIILIKGARQIGKTSLLARGLDQARRAGCKVVQLDFQELNESDLVSLESFYAVAGARIAEQLDLEVLPHAVHDPRRSPNSNFERFMRREVLAKLTVPLVWGMDEVDRLFQFGFKTELFALFRSWHNKRALEPDELWKKLSLVISYATETHFFITDLNQSPFNVGTQLVLADFGLAEVQHLNRRYGGPLKDESEINRFVQLAGGQPFLVQRGLHELATKSMPIGELEKKADHEEGIFRDHLRRLLVLLAKDAPLREAVTAVLRGEPCPALDSFYRLRSAGVLAGETMHEARLRCGLYSSFLRRNLL